MSADRTVTVRLTAIVDGWKRAMSDAGKSVDGLGDKTKRTTKDADKSLKDVGKSAAVSGKAMAVGLAAGAYAAYKLAGAASDLAETQSKVKQIFGASADALGAWSDEAATAMGQSKQQALDAASTFGIFGKSAGLAGDDLTDFSKRTTELAGDLASFNNTSPEDAITALGAALRGESEPIRRYGVLLDDATLRNRAMQMGLIETTKTALTPQQKVLAAYQEILAQTTTQQGDFARTSDGMANSQRIAAAEFANAKTELGEGLTPAFTGAFKAAAKALGVFNALPGPVRNTALAVVALGAAAAYLAPKIVASKVAMETLGTQMPRTTSGMKVAAKGLGVLAAAYATLQVTQAAFHSSDSELLRFVEETAAAAGPDTQSKIDGLTKKYEELRDVASAGGVEFWGGGLFWSSEAADAADQADALKERIDQLVSEQKIATIETKAGAGATKLATGAMGEQVEVVKSLQEEMDTLNGITLSQRDAQRGYQAALDDASASLKKNGKGLDIHTAKGRANAEALDGIATAATNELVALDASGASAERVERRHSTMRAELIRAGIRFGLTREKAKKYAESVLAIPKHVNTTVDLKIVMSIPSLAQRLHHQTDADAGYAAGGLITGYGTGTSDSIPTNLSNGEFVMRAAAVRRIGVGTLSAMNTGGTGGGSPLTLTMNVDARGATMTRGEYESISRRAVDDAFGQLVMKLRAS
jgi:hypothetical protein